MNPTSSFEYLEHAPRGPLATRVKCLWALRAPARAGAEFEPVFPDGCPELVLNLAEPFERRWREAVERQHHALLVGQLLEPIRIRPTGAVDIVGIRFHPWGLHGLRGLVPADLTAATLPADLLRPRLPLSLAAELAEVVPLDGRCRLLERLLAGAWGDGAVAPPPLITELASGRPRSVSRLALAAGITTRQVERLSARWIGLAPLEFIRLARFQHALHLLRHYPERPLGRIALESGFADQPHFSRDFSRFAGATPSAFRASIGGLTAAFITEEAAAAGEQAD